MKSGAPLYEYVDFIKRYNPKAKFDENDARQIADQVSTIVALSAYGKNMSKATYNKLYKEKTGRDALGSKPGAPEEKGLEEKVQPFSEFRNQNHRDRVSRLHPKLANDSVYYTSQNGNATYEAGGLEGGKLTFNPYFLANLTEADIETLDNMKILEII
jgi:hypothetical protein